MSLHEDPLAHGPKQQPSDTEAWGRPYRTLEPHTGVGQFCRRRSEGSTSNSRKCPGLCVVLVAWKMLFLITPA